LIASFLVWNLKPAPPRALMRFALVLPATERLTGRSRNMVAFSPDGKHVVYSANQQLYLRAMDQLEATPIRGTAEGTGRSPFFSPDGQWVGFYAGGQLKKVSIRGGAPVTLCEAANPWGASWAADDRIVFGQGPERIFQVPATGGSKELLISVDSAKNEEAHGPQILPGGEAVLFTLRSGGSWDDAQIVVHSLETGERKVLINGGRDGRYVPTGHLVYAREGTLMAVPFDVVRLEVTGGPVPTVEGVRQAAANLTGAAQFSFSGLGSLVYVPGTREIKRTLVWVDREGNEEPLVGELSPSQRPRVSPDGTRLAITIADSGNEDVWIYDLARKTSSRLTFDPASDSFPVWTPDGRRVVFSSTRDGGQYNLFWKAADGTGQVQRLTTSPNSQIRHSFSPDGKQMVFVEVDPETEADLYVLSMEGELKSQPLVQTDFREIDPAISPDGRWMAYESDETGQLEVYVRPFPNVEEGKWQISGERGGDPVWSPEGRELFYYNFIASGMMAVRIETEPTFSAGSPVLLFTGRYRYGQGRQYDIHPDGQRFLMIKEGGQTEGASAPTQLIIVQNWFEELKRLVPTGE
ncbi:hypothetical protein MYX78_13620, partial [Acidobacteria bacterium AH-259-G07]|nr:hypothetical protein [Acidobacteria bacterium AH-259-G07]